MRNFIAIFLTLAAFQFNTMLVFADVDGIQVKYNLFDQFAIDEGKIIYAENCASCHGENLEGQENWKEPDENDKLPAPPHDATGHTWHHDDDLLFEITKFGLARMIDDPSYKTDMPIYEEVLEDNEIIAVLTFIKSTWQGKEKSWNDQVNEQADQYWEASPTIRSIEELQGKSISNE